MSKSVLVVGGNGALGKSVVNKFKNCTKNPWIVTSLDMTENKNSNKNILLNKQFISDSKYIDQIHSEIGSNQKFNSVICVAGGFEAVGLSSNSIIQSVNNMMNMNFYSTLLTVHLAQKYLANNSLLALTGAGAIRNKLDTTGILSYQLAKQGVENITDTITNYPALLPLNTKVVTICPGTIDTEANRKGMPGADTSKWVSPDKIASLLKEWSEAPNTAHKETYYFI